MTSRSRSRLLIALAIFFIVASPIILFWSQGYRFDTKTRSFVRVGGLYFKVIPRDAKLVIEGIGSRRLRPSLLSEGTLLNNLLPGVYDITVSKEGYFPWSKSLAVKPLQVTKATSIVLFPAVPTMEPMGTFAVSDFWPVEGKTGTFYFADASGRRLFLFEGGRQGGTPKPILGTDPETSLRERVTDVAPSPDGSLLLVKLAGETLLVNASGTHIRSLSRYFTQLGMPTSRFETIVWHPAKNQTLIGVASQNRIYEIDLAASTYRLLLPKERIVALDQAGTLIADSSGNLYRLAASKEGVEKFDEIPMPEEITQALLYALPQRQYLLLDTHANLWCVERDTKPRMIAQGVVGVWPHPDGSRIAFVTRNQVLSVYFLAETAGDILYGKGAILKLGLVGQAPRHIFWMKDDWHVLLHEPEQIEIFEVDSRLPINRVSYPIAVSRALWKYDQNTLLYASQNSFWSWRL